MAISLTLVKVGPFRKGIVAHDILLLILPWPGILPRCSFPPHARHCAGQKGPFRMLVFVRLLAVTVSPNLECNAPQDIQQQIVSCSERSSSTDNSQLKAQRVPHPGGHSQFTLMILTRGPTLA